MSPVALVFRSTHYDLIKDEDEEKLELRSRYYPTSSYENNVTTYIKFYKDRKIIDVYRVRKNWDGTGHDDIAYVEELSDDEFNRLLEAARKVENVEDFDNLVKEIRKVSESIEEKYKKKLDELINEFISLSDVQEKLKNIQDEEIKKELIERLKNEIDDLLSPDP